MQEFGTLKKGQTFYSSGHKIVCNTSTLKQIKKYYDIIDVGGKEPSKCNLQTGDIVLYSNHVNIYAGKDSSGKMLWYEAGKSETNTKRDGGTFKRMAQENDVLMSVRAPVGDLNVAYEPCCIGRGLGAIHSNNNHQSYVLYTMMALNPQLDRYNGEGTVFGSINSDALNKMEINIPPISVMDSFEKIVSPMDNVIRKNYEENSRLISLRDCLLPKLMSGEMDLSDLNI